MPSRRKPITEADYSVEDRGYETPCWIWLGPRSTQGYGRFGRNRLVHALVYAAENGKPPDGYVVHHRCEQRLCIRGDHLEAITRQSHPARHRKISLELAEEIRRAPGSTRQVARRYGISKSHVAVLRKPLT